MFVDSGVFLHPVDQDENGLFWVVDFDYWPRIEDLRLRDEDLKSIVNEMRDLALVDCSVAQWDKLDAAKRKHISSNISATKRMIASIAPQKSERRAQGFYTINEAAETIWGNDQGKVRELEGRLSASAKAGDLPMFWPDSSSAGRLRYGYTNKRPVRTFYEVARWCDLNDWLTKNEPEIRYVFPRPEELDVSPQPALSSGKVAGDVYPEPPAAKQSAVRTAHRRDSPMRALVRKAKTEADEPENAQSAWNAFVEMAKKSSPPNPMMGYVEGEGVKWQAENGTVKIMENRVFVRRFNNL
ncbi:hypothetical protein CY652_10625 [Burkholderia sp. WAC0059]|nr:hypothetical protein CY652_10625 [Burkholderia sp. WAC0059]